MGYIVLYESKDIPLKISKFGQAAGEINQIFTPLSVKKHTRYDICRTLATSVLAYGSEA
jgi:hypothetical protein